MFGSLSLLQLQQYWWFIIAILGGFFVFITFVQGGQTLIFSVAKNEDEKTLMINSLGRKWELSFTTLVMFGGALFAAFPLFYSVSFGGAYAVWMAILFTYIIEAVSYEYRKKNDNFLGQKTYEIFMFINGSLGVFLIGAALGTLFTGGNFFINQYHFSTWKTSTYGLEALLNPFNVAFGLMLLFLARIQGALYFINNIKEVNIVKNAKNSLKLNTIIFLAMFLFVVFKLLTMTGVGYDEQTKVFSLSTYKYLHNLLSLPVVGLGFFIIGAVSVLYAIISTLFTDSKKGIWFSGVGSILVGISLFSILGYNHTSFYPSLYDLQSSLSIENASGSKYTLTTMSYVSLLVPIVLAYIFFAWRAMDRGGMDENSLKSDMKY